MNDTRKTDQETAEKSAAPIPQRAIDWTLRVWRPAGTAVIVGLALLLTWHVINGKNGLSVWHQKRSEDQQLQREIKDLQDENARLKDHVEHLKTDPEAIEREARVKLHYAKAGEVIVALPPENSQTQSAPAGK
jgi:cell division protein FtsB